MLAEHHFVIPDRIFFGLTALVIVLTAGLLIWAIPELPASLPSHFGFSGQPDDYSSSKTFLLMLPVLMQLLLAFLVSWAYRHPLYFNYPTRRKITSLSKPAQIALMTLARHVLVVVLLIAVLIIAHLGEGIVVTGLGLSGAPDPGIVLFLMGFLCLAIGVYIGWMRRIIRLGTSDGRPLQG